MDLAKYVKVSITGDQNIENVSNFKLIDTLAATTHHTKYYKLIYTYQYKALHLKVERYLFEHDDQIYILNFGAEEEKFEHYRRIGEDILNSFVFK